MRSPHRLRPCLVLAVLLLLAACGVREDGPTAFQPVADTAPASSSTDAPTPGITVIPAPGLAYPGPAPTVDYPVLATALAATAAVARQTPTPEPIVTVEPVGPLLREVWPKGPSGTPRTTMLFYSAGGETFDDPAVFWRVNLPSQQQREYTVAAHNREGVVGQLSPQGTWIAYLAGDDYHSLRVVMRNGQHDREVASGLGGASPPCLQRFAWSPKGDQLAFMQHWNDGPQFGEAFYTYDLHGQAGVQRIVQVGLAHLIGWLDAQHLLVLVNNDRTRPLQLEAIDTETGTRQVLAELPVQETPYCERLSPDRQKLLLSLEHHVYLFDLPTRQFTALDLNPGLMVWGADSTTVLEFSGTSARTMRLLQLDRSGEVTTLSLSPPYQPSNLFGLLSASPDGAYLVGCDIEQRGDIPIRYRSWLYEVASDSWQPLYEGNRCADILGWFPVH